ncbi:MAG: hypothetical protein KDC80_01500 [Saprospiraceae bacterium]|nr:hypothetical protein [Saprospiraceae bacterium]
MMKTEWYNSGVKFTLAFLSFLYLVRETVSISYGIPDAAPALALAGDFFNIYLELFVIINAGFLSRFIPGKVGIFYSFLPALVLWSFFQILGLAKYKVEFARDTIEYPGELRDKEKLRGVHYFGRFRDQEINFEKICQNNIEHLVLVPYGYQAAYNRPELDFERRNRRRSFDRDSMYLVMAQKAGAEGLEVIVKPHIWMRPENGKWRSDIGFSNLEDFEKWAADYSAFILHYARLSENMGASHFCIGTELAGLTRDHDAFWRDLIKKVRKEFSGKIFYAANWYREYEQIDFWTDLDFIGVQAYFPICKRANPSVGELKEGWKVYRQRLRKISRKYNRPILFSELGYRSMEDAAIDPWAWVDHESASGTKMSEETQARCYEAFFQTFWHEPWFSGALIWQWHAGHEEEGELDVHARLDFTPQNKVAQEVMATWFGR